MRHLSSYKVQQNITLRVEITPITAKLLEDKVFEEREEYEFISIEVLDPKGSAQFSTPK